MSDSDLDQFFLLANKESEYLGGQMSSLELWDDLSKYGFTNLAGEGGQL